MSEAEAEAKPVGERVSADERSPEAERQRFLDAVAQGMADADAGRVRSHAEVVARMRARFAERAKH
ncbi:hypothetical protein [Enhygromyxa salina]|uniref:hypothetical protein n=1 Tax=Enhygromyxa salina TaxID=215803 RepID=UPI0011B1E5F9|nr:hypothetical protein [Enhygromyxa salina]